ncbi:MAG: DUF4097 domain-containing protein [Prevotella sp.]|nr:DUF4097 domain-containing protein [Staphylococcus sp.]MCM1349844.1 DUF4097 domain-containing protein [Prevotella sp.]
MKKIAIFKIVAFSILAVLLTGVLIFGLANGFTSINCSLGGYHYSNSSSYAIAKGELTFSGSDIESIEINWIGGKVSVEETNEDTIRLQETYSEKTGKDDDNLMRYRVRNNQLTIQFCKSKWYVNPSVRNDKALTLYLPIQLYEKVKIITINANIDVQGKESDLCYPLKIDSVSGNIRISQAHLSSLDIDNVSGRIDISKLYCKNDIDIDTVSGSVSLKETTANRLDIDFVSSRIDITGSISRMKIDGVSGDLYAIMHQAPQEIDCDTVSGDVELTIPDNDGFTAQLDSVSGEINSNFSTSYSQKQLIYKDGGNTYRFESVSGDVTIHKQD